MSNSKHFIFCLNLLLLIIGSNCLSAQTLFQRPDTTPDYENYAYYEQCHAAIERVIAEVDNKDKLWRDTISYDLTLVPRELPAVANKVGKLCLSKLQLDTVALERAHVVAAILSQAGMYEESDKLLFRLVRSANETFPLHGSVLDSSGGKIGSIMGKVAGICTLRRPAKFQDCRKFFDVADSLVTESDSSWYAMLVAHELLKVERSFGMFDSMRTVSRKVLDLWEMQPPSRREAEVNGRMLVVRGYIIPALKEGFLEEELESLTISTDAYRKLRDSNWNRYAQFPINMSGNPDNIVLPEIKGNWFFKNSYSIGDKNIILSSNYNSIEDVRRPLPGKINVIAFLQGGCHGYSTRVTQGRDNAKMNCYPHISSLRRLKEQFPDIEITVVTKTYGLYANGAPLPPASEADTLASLFLGFHQIPGVQIVAEGEFLRIPGIDNRRVDVPVDYEHDYQKEGMNLSFPGFVVLVDEVGKVFHADGIVGIQEEIAHRKLESVFKRLSRSAAK